jgi:hypothetical protein
MPSILEDDYLAFIQIFKACLLTHHLLIVIDQLAAKQQSYPLLEY